MTYLIDSNWIILALNGKSEAVALLDQLIPDGIAISVITYMEVFQGLDREPDPEKAIAQFEALLSQIPVIPFSLPVARRCARLRETLKTQNKRVNSRALDLINAATALEHDMILVTSNLTDYKDITDLSLYNYQSV
jgi:tRNA(fMet)-specific endonuclease VapC